MTTILEEERACGQCGQRQTLAVVHSSLTWGSPSLDGRPPQGLGAALALSIQHCPRCGWVAGDLRGAPAAAEAVVLARADYQALLADESVPVAVRRFRALAMLCEARGDAAGAARAAWHAAWAADDAADAVLGRHDYPRDPPADAGDPFARLDAWPRPVLDPRRSDLSPAQAALVQRWLDEVERAREARREAARRWRAALALGQPPRPDAEGALVLADLLRRSGDFDAAIAEAESALAGPSATGWDDEPGDVLRYQIRLARDRDAGLHRVEDAEKSEPGWEARRERRQQRAREHEAERQRAAAEHLAWCVPANLDAPLAQVLADGGLPEPPGPLTLERLRPLPMPTGIAEEIVRLATAGAWPARATLAAIGLALQRAAPALGWQARAESWQRDCAGCEPIVDHLAFLFRRCRPDMWHLWPPAGPDDGPPAPVYTPQGPAPAPPGPRAGSG